MWYLRKQYNLVETGSFTTSTATLKNGFLTWCGKTYTGWYAALRLYNGIGKCNTGDPQYVEKVNNIANNMANYFLQNYGA